MRQYPTNYYLWGVFAAMVFGPTALLVFVGRLHDRALRGFEKDLILIGLASVAVGWVTQAVAVVVGVRVPEGKRPEQAEDFEDGPRT